MREVHGAANVGRRAIGYRRSASTSASGLSTAPSAASPPQRQPFAVVGLTIRNGRIAEMNILSDPDRLARVDLTVLAN